MTRRNKSSLQGRRCLFCFRSSCSSETQFFQHKMPGGANIPKLKSHLQKFFILKNILDMEDRWLQNSLRRCSRLGEESDEPENAEDLMLSSNSSRSDCLSRYSIDAWFSLCEQCFGWVERAWNFHQRIIEFQVKFDQQKLKLKDKLRKEVLRNRKLESKAKSYSMVGVANNVKDLGNDDEGVTSLYSKRGRLIKSQNATAINSEPDINLVTMNDDDAPDFSIERPNDVMSTIADEIRDIVFKELESSDFVKVKQKRPVRDRKIIEPEETRNFSAYYDDESRFSDVSFENSRDTMEDVPFESPVDVVAMVDEEIQHVVCQEPKTTRNYKRKLGRPKKYLKYMIDGDMPILPEQPYVVKKAKLSKSKGRKKKKKIITIIRHGGSMKNSNDVAAGNWDNPDIKVEAVSDDNDDEEEATINYANLNHHDEEKRFKPSDDDASDFENVEDQDQEELGDPTFIASEESGDEDEGQFEEKVNCPHCCLTFRKSKLQTHVALHEKWKNAKKKCKFSCTVCSFPAKDAGKLKTHMSHYHTPPPTFEWVCPALGCSFQNADYHVLKGHVVQNHAALKEEDLADHPGKRNALMEYHLQCSGCSKKYKGMPGKFARHRRRRYCEKRYPCMECGETEFKTKVALQAHKNANHPKTKTSDGPYMSICHICGLDYPSFRLKSHIRNIHPEASGMGESSATCNSEKSFKCRYCDLTSSFKVVILRHMRQAHLHKHDVGKECPHCQKKYTTNFALKRHVQVAHEKSTEIPCPFYCGKIFFERGSVRQHLMYCKVKKMMDSVVPDDDDTKDEMEGAVQAKQEEMEIEEPRVALKSEVLHQGMQVHDDHNPSMQSSNNNVPYEAFPVNNSYYVSYPQV